ncbi:hypothetical protein CDEST_10852 [Colletotrichum destructivum]|uniref:Uncharacterized protein n=1 Tax=Colletotrichum destructivum TaxID=34406 RepID=A0AAX4IRT6_9PEZI|nr:hypothetical protein CDEST_10852 [Colletotrichum destructivum]
MPDIGGMIRNLSLPVTLPLPRIAAHSSMGRLSTLPTELMIFSTSSASVLSLLSRASSSAKETVEAFPPSQEFLEHAPDVLTALDKTQPIQHHSAALLQQVLRSKRAYTASISAPFSSSRPANGYTSSLFTRIMPCA